MAISTSKAVDQREGEQPKDTEISMNGKFDGTQDSSIEVQNFSLSKEMLEAEKFYNEELLVMVMETAAENMSYYVPIWLNGQLAQFLVGYPTKAKRKFVEQLIMSKSGNVTTHEVTGNDGLKDVKVRVNYTPNHPVSILHDPNPKKGREWLTRVSRAAV